MVELDKGDLPKIKLNPVTLRFQGELGYLEEEFRDAGIMPNLTLIRVAVFLGFIVFMAFGFLDHLIPGTPEMFRAFRVIRLGVAGPLMLATLLLSFLPFLRSYMEFVVAGLAICLGTCLIMFIFLEPPPYNQADCIGLVLLLIFLYAFVRLRYLIAAVAGWTLFIIFLVLKSRMYAHTNIPLLYNAVYLIFANLIGMSTNYVIEVYARKQFAWRMSMVRHREKIEELNRNMQGIIEEQTSKLRQEILERTRSEEALRQAQKMQALGTMAGGIAHEFNNILYPVLGYAEMARESIPKENPGRPMLSEIIAGLQQAGALVENILRFSRQKERETEPLNLSCVVKDTLRLFRIALPSNISLATNLDTKADCIMGDATELHQVIMNLCANACHAMRADGGVLTIGVRIPPTEIVEECGSQGLPEANYVELYVTDTGHGIPEDVRKQVFDPYFTTKDMNEGTGMGLSLVQGIVERHKGIVTLSTDVGKGSTFRIFLPQITP